MAGCISTVLSEAHLVNRTLVEHLLFEETHGISYCQYILGGPFYKPLWGEVGILNKDCNYSYYNESSALPSGRIKL